ncbi:E1-E2 ATPase family protein [Acetobacter orientalis]|uniref:E1-E2 ATPase family protein n=1 Tax=Acetobacter orientalis TaxID=146474 RepID=A0A2Z5ZIG4_9PROT|nr:E1-E2 ATPase family protein [Acetobacter orientalis]
MTTATVAPLDNASDIILALKEYSRKNGDKIQMYWDLPEGFGTYHTFKISWDYHIFDMGKGFSHYDFPTLVASEALDNYNLPYENLFIVSRDKDNNGNINYIVTLCHQAHLIDDKKTITTFIFHGMYIETQGWYWNMIGYSPRIFETPNSNFLSTGFEPMCSPCIEMKLEDFVLSFVADRGLFQVYYLLWLYNAKTRMVSSSVPLGALARKHNRKPSSRKSPIKAPIIITPSPSTVTILSSSPVAGSGGWTMRPHSRSGHWRTYKNTGKRIWVESYDVHGGATGPQIYKTP